MATTNGLQRWARFEAGACALLLAGCVSAPPVNLPKAGANVTCITPAAAQEVAVGVSLSGGGSRAALFGAGGLEALGRLPAPGGGSVLERVSYLSSVSGGGLAAAYYALHKPAPGSPMLAADGALSAPYQAFFDDFQAKLSQDFESALIWRQIGAFRFLLNSALAARSLREVLEENLLGTGTFGDLSEREQRGEVPRTIFNTTLYNNGRRLMMTTLPPDTAQFDYTAALEKSLAERGKGGGVPDIIRQRWESLLPITPLELEIDPCTLPVAMAVTASASFPPLVGPITFTVGDQLDYWHTGDGGLYENLGLESLMFAFLKQLQDHKLERAVILAFNSAYPFAAGFRELSERAQPWTIFNYDFGRIQSIMEERATDYWSLFYRSNQLQGVLPGDRTLRIIFLNHGEARWADDLADLPAACRHETPPLASPEDVQDRLRQIPTRFEMNSACDRALLHAAAANVVEQHRKEIDDFLAGREAAGGARP